MEHSTVNMLIHNATKVKGNKYIWNVDKLDQNKMEIRLQISKTQLAKKRGYGLLLFYLIIIGMFGYGYSKYRKDPSMFNKLQSKVSKVFKKNQ